MASLTESLTAPGPSGSSLYESTSNADLENRSRMRVRVSLFNNNAFTHLKKISLAMRIIGQ